MATVVLVDDGVMIDEDTVDDDLLLDDGRVMVEELLLDNVVVNDEVLVVAVKLASAWFSGMLKTECSSISSLSSPSSASNLM